MLAWLMATAYIWPVLWVLYRSNGSASSQARDVRPISVRMKVGSLIVAMIFAKPTYSQLIDLIGLPMHFSYPIALSSIVWCAVVAGFWVAFVRRSDAQVVGESITRRAVMIASLILLLEPALVLWIVLTL